MLTALGREDGQAANGRLTRTLRGRFSGAECCASTLGGVGRKTHMAHADNESASEDSATPGRAATRVASRRAPRPEWEGRLSISAIFGAHLSEARTAKDHYVSIERLAEHSRKSARWLRSVERGEVLLSESSIKQIEVGLKKANKGLEGEANSNLVDIYKGYANDPFSKKAGELTARLGSTPEDRLGEVPVLDADKTLPMISSLSAVDRILVLWPSLLFIALLVLLTGATTEALGQEVEDPLSPGTVVLGGLGIASAAVLAVPLVGAAQRMLIGRLRFGRLNAYRKDLRGLREAAEIPEHSRYHWYHPVASAYLHPVDRADAEHAALEAELAERLRLVFGSAALIGMLLLGYCASSASNGLGWLIGFNAATLVLWATSSVSAHQAAQTAVVATFHGLGHLAPSQQQEQDPAK